MIDNQQMKFEILRLGSVVDSMILNSGGLDDDSYEISSTRSVNSFPTLTVKSSEPDINNLLMKFSKKDIIRLSILTPHSDESSIFFEGEFKNKIMSFTKETNMFSIEMDAVHSFYGLSMMQLSSSFDFSDMTFGEFIKEIGGMAGGQSQIIIAEELSTRKITGISYRSNAYRLFKELCLFLNASVSFNADNSIEIDYRSRKIDKIRTKKPVPISRDDCINFQVKD